MKKFLIKHKNKIILLLAILVTILLLFLGRKESFKVINKNEIPDLPRPFVNLYNDNGEKVNVILVTHPFTRQTGDNGSFEQYKEWKDRIHFIGATSYSEFPSVLSNPHDTLSNPEDDSWKLHNYMKYFNIWLNCFRDPDKYIKDKSTKKALISESDFINKKFKPKKVDKEYDFMYICLEDDGNVSCNKGWNYYIRNWELAKKCIKIMCQKYKLRGLIIGRKNCKLPDGCKEYITMKDKMSQDELINHYHKTNFLFLPNIVDASPRTLTEALACDMRCLVNYNILGGWKYVNKNTGEFFNNEKDFEPALQKLLNNYNNYNPSEYFWSNYGEDKTGVKLRDFLLTNINNLNFDKNSTKYITMRI